MTALIGHSGFVGSNIKAQASFDFLYNSKNFREMAGKSYDLIVCSGIPAVKWWANKNPQEDLQQIQALLDILKTVRCKHFVLISTIDVYKNLRNVNEDSPTEFEQNHAYGHHRGLVEEFIRQQFSQHTIVRLTGLFGQGLKKNVIFDLLNDNCLDMINPQSSFQYYDLSNIWADIEKVRENGLELVNLATEPLKTNTILENFFPDTTVGQNASPEAHYDIHSKYASYWSQTGSYLYNQEQVLEQLKTFIQRSRTP